MLTTVLFINVILAIVYSSYKERAGECFKDLFRDQQHAIHQVFRVIADRSVDGSEPLVPREEFDLLMKELSTLEPIDPTLCCIMFEALDDDNSGALTKTEFEELPDVLRYDYKLTRRDSAWIGKVPEGF